MSLNKLLYCIIIRVTQTTADPEYQGLLLSYHRYASALLAFREREGDGVWGWMRADAIEGVNAMPPVSSLIR